MHSVRFPMISPMPSRAIGICAGRGRRCWRDGLGCWPMAEDSSQISIRLTVNGREERAAVPAAMTLLELLRDRLALKGTKLSCSRAVCGACTVLIDGDPAASCAVFAFQAGDRAVTTIEGMQADGALHPIQQAFMERSAFQCG